MAGLVLYGTPSKQFTPLSAGSHVSRCFSVVDLGTQQSEYLGTKRSQQKLRVSFEVPDELTEDGKPMVVSRNFTASLHENSKFREFLMGWRGRDFTDGELKRFELKAILGKPAILTIVHQERDGKVYANLDRVAPLLKGQTAPDPVNESIWFDLTNFDQSTYEKLSKYVQETIAKSPEFQQYVGNAFSSSHIENEDEEIPF